MKQKTNKLLFSLYYAHMTFLVIKEQNFLLVVRSADVYARKNGESGKCNGTWPNHWPNRSSIAIPMQPRYQGFSRKEMCGPTHFLRRG